jgi:PAS domain S-box-containing protein
MGDEHYRERFFSDKLFNISIDMLGIVGFDGFFKLLNPSWSRLLGWSNEVLLSRLWVDFVHPDDLSYAKNLEQSILSGAEIIETEIRFMCKDGNFRWLSWTFYPQVEQSFVFTVARDISGLKETEERLKKSEQLLKEQVVQIASVNEELLVSNDELRSLTNNFSDTNNRINAILEAIPDLVFVFNRQGVYVDCYTSESSELIGQTNWFINKSIYDVVPKHIAEKTLHHIDELFKTGRQQVFQYMIPVNNVEMHYGVRMVRFQEDKALAVARNITPQIEAEMAMRDSQLTFRALFEKGPIGVAYHRMIYDETGKPVNYYFLEANQSYQNLTGVNPTGKMVTEAFPGIENDPFDWIGKFGEVAKNGKEIRFQQYLQPNNRWYDCVGYQYKPDHFVAAFLEITDYKLAQEALQKSEVKYRTLFETMSEGVFYQHKDGKLIDVNQSALNLFGLTRDQFIGRTSRNPQWAVVDGEGNPLPIDQHPSVLSQATGKPVLNFELGVFNPAFKKVQWLLVSAIPQFLEGGDTPDHVFVTMTDISPLKETQKILRRKNAFIQTVLDNLPIGVALNETDKGVASYMNRKFIEIYGWDESVLEDVPSFFEAIYPDKAYREKIVGQIMADIASGDPARMKWDNIRVTHADGSTRYVNAVNIPLPEQNTMVSTVMDVTKQMLTEKQLRENEERYRLIFEQSPLAMFQYDVDGAIVNCNDKLVEIIGSSKEKLIGLRIDQLKDVRLIEAMEGALLGQETTFEGFYTPVTGTRSLPMRMIFSPLKIDDKVTGAIAFGEDRTALMQKEEFEREVAIAKEAVKFKQNFLANMSHEIRTPLTGIMGVIDILSDSDLDSEKKGHVEILKNTSESLMEIVNQVLDFSKIEEGKLSLKFINFDFHDFVKQSTDFYRNLCKSDIKILTQIDHQIPAQVRADKTRMAQVFNNLLSNAVKFTNRGTITIAANLDELPHSSGQMVGDDTPDLLIKISVTDTGIGIAPEKQKILFQPFVQVDETENRAYEGTGLGLSISKQLVALHGGQIGLESLPGKGSCFWFTFRAKAIGHGGEPAGPPIDAREVGEKNLKILLAEDKVFNQRVISLMLTHLGHDVSVASNGQEALDMAQSQNYDLILMDIQMPVMDGVTATQKLKQLNKKPPPIVGLSANAFEGDREKYMELGLDEYLTKPLRKDEFSKLVSRMFC